MVLFHETNRISTTVGVVPRVQAKRDQRRIGLFDEPLDLVFILHMRLGMRVEDRLQSESFLGFLRYLLDFIDEPLPRVVVKLLRNVQLTRPKIRIRIVNQDDIFSIGPGNHLTGTRQLPFQFRIRFWIFQVHHHERPCDF